MHYPQPRIERADRFRAALAHLSFPIVLITGTQYQNQWWLYALLIAIPLLMSALGQGPILDRRSYPVPYVVHHVRRAIDFVLKMAVVAVGLAYIIISWSNSLDHQTRMLAGLLQSEDSLFWFLTLVYHYQDVATHPLFEFAAIVLAGAVLIGVLVPIRNALSAIRGELRTF